MNPTGPRTLLDLASSREQARSAALARYNLPDTTPEAAFDRITTLTSLTFDVPIALVSLISEDKQYFKSCFGLELPETGRETTRSTSFCTYAVESPRVMVIPDATLDPRFCDNPLVTGHPHIRFYAGAPLTTPEGISLGTLCVIDTKPRDGLTPAQTRILSGLAGTVMELLEARRVIHTLAEERAFNLAVLENISDGVVACNARGELTVFNEAARTLHGLPELPLEPSAWSRHYDLYASDGTTPLALEQIPLYRAYQGEIVKDVEMVVAPKWGHPRHLRASGRAFQGPDGKALGAVVAMRNITSERQASVALQNSEHHHRVIIESLHEGVVQQEADGRISTCNTAAERILGLSRAQMLGRESSDPRWRAVHEDGTPYPSDERPTMRALKTGISQKDGVFGVHKPDGTLTWIQVNAQPLFYPGETEPHAVVSSFADITDLKETERQLRHSALHDELTGLPTRVLLLDRLETAALRASRLPNTSYALLFIDLDNFKAVNDTLGHRAGDTLLIGVAQRLRDNVREGDTVSRLGGDEFVVLLEGLVDPEDVTSLTERLANSLNTTLRVGETEVRVSASIGVALPDANTSGTALLEQADAAMYRAKATGKEKRVGQN